MENAKNKQTENKLTYHTYMQTEERKNKPYTPKHTSYVVV